jgi:RNA polymerase sigma-70 factor, ECF subfamily
MNEWLTNTEASIRAAWDAGDCSSAATLLLESYRKEITSFLKVRLHDRTAVEDAFSIFAEAIWKGLPNFEWRCHARTWAYTVARNTAGRYLASPHQRPAHRLILRSDIGFDDTQRRRSTTRMHLRTTVKRQIRSLRERLPMEDQELLVLRVERALSWRELALTMSGNVGLDDDAVAREAARLRKCFERIRVQLTSMAKAEGLLPE